MAAIVKANSSLTAGGLVVLKRSFSASDSGQMNYLVDHACLSQFASRWTPFFKTGAQPPTALPANMLLLQLTKKPTLVSLETETVHGLTYFRATYSSGVETDVTITETSETRNIQANYRRLVSVIDDSSLFANSTVGFDYISISVTATSKNTNIPNVTGRVGQKFNVAGALWAVQEDDYFLNLRFGIARKNIETTTTSKNGRGEYTYSKTSTGIYQATAQETETFES